MWLFLTVFKTCRPMLLSQDYRIKSQVSEGHETCLKLYELSGFKRYDKQKGTRKGGCLKCETSEINLLAHS